MARHPIEGGESVAASLARFSQIAPGAEESRVPATKNPFAIPSPTSWVPRLKARKTARGIANINDEMQAMATATCPSPRLLPTSSLPSSDTARVGSARGARAKRELQPPTPERKLLANDSGNIRAQAPFT